LAQVAGRTGRGPRGGRVLVQTYNPEHPCIALAAAHDYIGFATRELAERNTHGYPPYQRLARVIVRSLKAEDAAAFADKLACAFRAAVARLTAAPGSPAVRVLGPAEAPVFRLKNYFRFNFQIQSPSAGLLHQVLREVLATTRSPRGVEYQVDVDAYNMM
jgi:primosomal protein N' (replication factor Y)